MGRFVALILIGVVLLSAIGSSGIAAAYAPGGPSNPHPSGNGSGSSGGTMGGGGVMGGGSGGTTTTTQNTTTATGGAGTGSTTQSPTRTRNSSSSAERTTNNSTPAHPVNATIRQFKRQHLGYRNLSASDKKQLRNILHKIPDTNSKKGKIALLNEMGKRINWPKTQGNLTRRRIVRANFGIGTNPKSTPNNPVNATLTQFKQQNLGYQQLSAGKKKKIRKNLQKLKQTGVRNSGQISMKQQRILSNIGQIFPRDGNEGKREKIIKQNFGFAQNLKGRGSSATNPDLPDIDIPNLGEHKLKAIADAFKKGASDILGKLYNLAFSTPVPKNTGWNGIFGTPTNQPFKNLYTNLLVEKFYPVTNILLGIGVILFGLSFTVNPLITKFRATNLMFKFVAFLFLYSFSWVVVTLMHGVVNDITMWIRPSQKAVEALVTNIDKMGAAAVGAYFVGSGGILATASGLALELGMRDVLLRYLFPYTVAPLALVLYLSPWQRLKSVASMALWQYVNVLTMIIPMAAFLKGATLIKFNPGSKYTAVIAMFVLLALFLSAVSIPAITTILWMKVGGKVKAGVTSAAAGAASRVGSAKDKLWGSESASDSTATGTTSPGDRAEAAVETTSVGSSASRTGVPRSGELSASELKNTDPSGSSETTASKVRALDKQQHRDPNNADAKYEAFFEDTKDTEDGSGPHRTTMNEKLAD